MHPPRRSGLYWPVHDSPLCPRRTRRAQDIAINTPIAVIVEEAAPVAEQAPVFEDADVETSTTDTAPPGAAAEAAAQSDTGAPENR